MTKPPAAPQDATECRSPAQPARSGPVDESDDRPPATDPDPPSKRIYRGLRSGFLALAVLLAAAATVYFLLQMQFEQRAAKIGARLAALEMVQSGAQTGLTATNKTLTEFDKRLVALENKADFADTFAGDIARQEKRLTNIEAGLSRLAPDTAAARDAAYDLQRRLEALEAKHQPFTAWRHELAAAWIAAAESALTVHNDGRYAEQALAALSALYSAAGDGEGHLSTLAGLRDQIAATSAARDRLRAELHAHAAATAAWDPVDRSVTAPDSATQTHWQRFKSMLAGLFVLRRATAHDYLITQLAVWRLATERKWQTLAQAIDFGDEDRLRREAQALSEHLAATDGEAADSALRAARTWLETLVADGLQPWPSLNALRAELAGKAITGPDS